MKPVLSGHSKNRQNKGLKAVRYLNAGQKYCRMLHGEHSAVLLTCIKRLSVIKTYFWSSFEWPLKTAFTVFCEWEPVLHQCHLKAAQNATDVIMKIIKMSLSGDFTILCEWEPLLHYCHLKAAQKHLKCHRCDHEGVFCPHITYTYIFIILNSYPHREIPMYARI